MSADLRHEMADAFDAVLGDMRQAASRLTAALAAERDALAREGATIPAVKARVRAALAARGVDYPATPRAPFT